MKKRWLVCLIAASLLPVLAHAAEEIGKDEVEAIVDKKLQESQPKLTEDGLTFVSSKFWKMSVGGLLQSWYQYTDDAPNTAYGFTNANVHNTFRVRRAEIKFSGSYRDKLEFYVMIDPAKNLFQNSTLTDSGGDTVTASQPRDDDSILQDMSLAFKYIPKHDVSIGQFKVPVSLEGFGSSAKLAFAERAIVSRTFGDRRDIGLMVTGRPIEEVQYELGIFNGEGPNELDRRNFKDIAGRLTVKPIKDLHVAGNFYRGRITATDNSNYRFGGELQYLFSRYFFQGEFHRGYGSICGTATTCQGMYAYAGADVWKKDDFTMQTVGRFEYWDPSLAAGNNIQYISTAGINLLLPDYHAKLQLNYSETEFQGPGRNNLVFVAVQFAL